MCGASALKEVSMSIRLERLGAERDRARRKRDEWESRYKELDQK